MGEFLMSPTEKIPLPFRWQFVPGKETSTGEVVWAWRVFSQAGDLVMQSERSFNTLTDCMTDAKRNGYERNPG
jgi:hypothetical protein